MVRWIMVCVSSSAFSICLNEEVHGYFKGGRGLRQGDPISPYLFTLVMEVFNIILCKNIEDSEKFNYHFGCKELKLTHMCFADDLLVLCKGNKSSVEVIKRSMEEFSSVLGLNPNIRKSTIFFGNVKGTEKQEILDLLPFKCGRLPVRYLRVPLLDKRLGVKDCKVLIDKVESKIKCWRNKTLSYAGRIQLVASVLSSMQNYWASVYLLPSAVVKDLDKLFKKFLWNSGDSAQGKSRIAWKLVCRPKDQGGLGIKPLKKWNEVLLIRQFWKIIENNESLWAKWVNLVKLKKKSIWNVQIDKSDSWGWKTMLKIRDEIKNHVWYKIGNGKSISVFYDRWCSIGPLSEMISRRNIYNERLRDDIVIADIVNNGRWAWPEDWMSTYPSLSNIQNPNLIARDDKVLWITKKGDKVQFSTKQAWEDLRDEWPKVNWSKVVWFNQLVPRHAFILWLAVQNKLLTQDRMEKWHKSNDLKCSLCKQCADSHDHLFFKCSYTMKVWTEVREMTHQLGKLNHLNDIVAAIANGKGANNITNVINKLLLAATIYFLWQERNKRIFKDECRNEEELCKIIKGAIKSKLMSLRVKMSKDVLKIAADWDLKWYDMQLVPCN
ncbi:RNA-directed DNA polymerase, eukaryota, reverse transcriptase zinc-binding domain protein [Tanacetum coccineum]